MYTTSSKLISLLAKGRKFESWLLKMEIKMNYIKKTKNSIVKSKEKKQEESIYKSIIHHNRLLIDSGNYYFSPNKKFLAVLDYQRKTWNIIDVNTKQIIDNSIENANEILFPTDDKVLYISNDKYTARPHQVWAKQLIKGTENSQLLLTSNDLKSHLNISITRDSSYVTITSVSHLSSQVWLLPVTNVMTTPPYLVKEAKDYEYYYMDSRCGLFYILTNAYNGEYQVMTAPFHSPSIWTPFYTPNENFILQDIEIFQSFVALYGTDNQLNPVIIIKDNKTDKISQPIVLKEYSNIENVPTKYNSKSISLLASSPIVPPQPITINTNTYRVDSNKERKSTNVKVHLHANTQDGVSIPITLFYDSKTPPSPDSPLLVITYGSYGQSLYKGYNETLIPLLSRGWVLAYCHIRGGGELGNGWHFQAMGNKKITSFKDLAQCITCLHDSGISSPHLTAVYGRSAGSLAVSGMCNMYPSLIQAVILEMPLVNLTNISTHYINEIDTLEFGHTRVLRESICPFHNLKPKNYPSFFVTYSTNDPLIPYKDVLEYTNKLKHCIKQYQHTIGNSSVMKRGSVLLNTETNVGHYWTRRVSYHHQGLLKLLFLTATIVEM